MFGSRVTSQAIPFRYPISIFKITSESTEHKPTLPTLQPEAEIKPQHFKPRCRKGAATFILGAPAAAGSGLCPAEPRSRPGEGMNGHGDHLNQFGRPCSGLAFPALLRKAEPRVRPSMALHRAHPPAVPTPPAEGAARLRAAGPAPPPGAHLCPRRLAPHPRAQRRPPRPAAALAGHQPQGPDALSLREGALAPPPRCPCRCRCGCGRPGAS